MLGLRGQNQYHSLLPILPCVTFFVPKGCHDTVMAKGHSFNKMYFLSTCLYISTVLSAEDTAMIKIQKSFYGAYILMRGGRQKTNKYIFQMVLSTLKIDREEQSISESCYVRKVVGSDTNRNLLGGFWRSFCCPIKRMIVRSEFIVISPVSLVLFWIWILYPGLEQPLCDYGTINMWKKCQYAKVCRMKR